METRIAAIGAGMPLKFSSVYVDSDGTNRYDNPIGLDQDLSNTRRCFRPKYDDQKQWAQVCLMVPGCVRAISIAGGDTYYVTQFKI